MTASGTAVRSVRRARLAHTSPSSFACICAGLSQLQLSQSRGFATSVPRLAVPSINPNTSAQRGSPPQGVTPISRSQLANHGKLQAKPEELKLTPAQRAAAAAQRARQRLREQEAKTQANIKMGGLADNSLFADDFLPPADGPVDGSQSPAGVPSHSLIQRSAENMALALYPRPNARLRWQRRMMIRHIRRSGRLTKEMRLARTERTHLARSHFFKTSMKKLAPLARQIAGKSIDEAILQMRFSNKKAARDVRQHLIQARNEAIVMRGMGLRPQQAAAAAAAAETKEDGPIVSDPGNSPPLPHQNPTKSTKKGHTRHETDIYIAQAWTNRGPYGSEPDYRAMGRVYEMRPPYTGLSVMLKEEKTRTREKAEKEARAVKKRMGKNMWTQLPDRPVTNQSQYVLW